jgi:hypothetical protein
VSELDDAVRRWAMGVYPVEAGAELLIRQGKAIREGVPWLHDVGPERGQRIVEIDHVLLWSASRSWSGTERRVVDIARCLLNSRGRVNLHDAVYGLDSRNLELVLAAVAHAAGSHETSAPGRPLEGGHRGPASLFPWPSGWNVGRPVAGPRRVVDEPQEAATWPDAPPIAAKHRESRTAPHEPESGPSAPHKSL